MVKILATNDDGIHAEGLWALVRELKKIAQVTVAAPDGERSAIGTAVTLFQPLHASEFCAPEDGVKAYAIDGSPSDCVILALGKLITDNIDIVISGINRDLNLGEDVYSSGTVGAAMQGYFRGLPALAVSAPKGSTTGFKVAAQTTAALVQIMASHKLARIFLNINVPDLPMEEVHSVKITRLARSSHINTVSEDANSQHLQYRLVRERVAESGNDGTDIQAIMQGNISITPLYTSLLDKPPLHLLKKVGTELADEIIK
jgi:5'-nucleotidase